MMQLISAANLLDQAWAQYSKQFSAFREPIIWALIPAVIAAFLPIIPGSTFGTTLLVGIIQIIATIIATVRIVDISWALHEGKAPSPALARTLSWGPAGRMFDYVFVSIIVGIVTVLGFLALIIPGIIFMNWFSFAATATLLEGVHGTGALKRSKELVSGRFWQIAWRWIVLSVVPGVLIGLTSLLVILVIAFATGTVDTAFAQETAPWWTELVNAVFSSLMLPFYIVASVIFFAEARKTQ